LGAFERLWIAHQLGQVNIKTIDHLYGYRIANIWANRSIVEKKLEDPQRREGWWMLIALSNALEDAWLRSFHRTHRWEPNQASKRSWGGLVRRIFASSN
jgi:hypothetical protein